MRFRGTVKVATLPFLLLAICLSSVVACGRGRRWVTTWSASPSTLPAMSPVPAEFQRLVKPDGEQTIREVVHTSLGGKAARIRVSNVFGKTALIISNAHIAVRSQGSGIIANTDRAVTFSGNLGVTIPAGADALSDPVSFQLPARADVAISLETTERTSADTVHFSALQSSYAAPGDQTAAAVMRDAVTITCWPFLTELQVASEDRNAGTVVAFGDSITDGIHSTSDANHRWPNWLAERLAGENAKLGVANAGIGGNRILHNGEGPLNSVYGMCALARFDRDVLALPGVRYMVVLLGINDIGQPGSEGEPIENAVSAVEIEAGLRQIVERAHEHRIKVMGATLLPFAGTGGNYYSPEKEMMRKAVNDWIRNSGAFDGVADFDKAIQDPAEPIRMRADYDGGDHLHPNDAGMKAMADSIPIDFFRLR